MGFEEKSSIDTMVADQKAALLRGSEPEEKRSFLQEAVHQAYGLAWDGDSATRRDAEKYTAQFVKSVPLFVGARWGTAAASAAFALDEVKTGDSLSMQGAELAAGLAKGYLTKKAFDHFGAKEWGFAQKGMAMGSAARLLDAGLTPNNYFVDGQLDVAGGLRRSIMNAGDAKALGVDVLTFGVAHGVGKFGQGTLKNGFLSSSLTGASFGLTSGTLGEFQRQMHTGEDLNYFKMLKAGTIEAGLMGLAAGVGYKMTPHQEMTRESEQRRTDWRADGRNGDGRNGVRTDSAELTLRNATDGAQRGEGQQAPTVKERGGYTGYFLTEGAVQGVRDGMKIDGKIEPPLFQPPEKLHITETFGTKETEGTTWAQTTQQSAPRIRVLGRAVDNTGVETLRVSVDGRTERADGRPYHITRSLAPGRKAAESMGVLEKALAVEKARTAGGTTEGVTAQDLAQFSYREFAPHEQFDVAFEARWHPSDSTPKEVKKPAEPKPEVPFEQLSPKLQVISALKNTPPDYFTKLLATRTPEHRAGSYFEMTPEQLKAELFKLRWEPFNPLDAQGQPIIGGGAIGYRATMQGGRLGMTPVDAIPETAQLYLIDPKGENNWAISTVGADAPKADTVTMIVGRDSPAEKHMVWTFHPGDPVRMSPLTAETMAPALKSAGIEPGADLPASGPGRRIPITRAQLDAINANLPQGSAMTMAKIETDANLGP